MKDATDKPTVMDKIAQEWAGLDLGVQIALSWLSVVLLGVIVLGVIFPLFGLIMLGIVVVVGTIAAVGYLLDY